MAITTTFDSTKEGLKDLLGEVQSGKVQLPDFQRDWVWDEDHIISLIASVSLSYPIGAIMLLQTGNPSVRFKPRVITGVQLPQPPAPERLILDGQQRLTSLFLSLLYLGAVPTMDTRRRAIKRFYYIDIAKALDENTDREEAIFAVPEDKIVRTFRGDVLRDCSSDTQEFEQLMFPLNQVFDVADWRKRFNLHWKYDAGKTALYDQFEARVIDRFKEYQVPVIHLRKENPKEAVCQVFEKVNTGGVSLNVFELLTATYAADDFSLRDDWAARQKHLAEIRVLSAVQSTEFLQAIALLATWKRRNDAIASGADAARAPGISCKRPAILSLTLDEYKEWADRVADAFKSAARFLHEQKIFAARDIPYPPQLVPFSAILTALASEPTAPQREKLLRWFWCGVFGELYGGATESRFARDLPEMLAWLNGGPEATTLSDCNFVPDRLLSMRNRISAAYKGLYALLMRDGAQDFRTGVPIEVASYFDDNIDIHHIFPRDWCRKNGVEPGRCDSIVNKTPLSFRTNRLIGGRAPSDYLQRLEKEFGSNADDLNKILRSHVIDPAALRSDNFDAFFQGRQQALLQRIEASTGRPVVREVKEPQPAPSDYEAEEAVLN
jgi:hypothetical protein